MSHSDILESCRVRQQDEILTLQSIYGELITVLPNPSQKAGIIITLSIPIVLPSATPADLSSPISSSLPLELTHLPPITIRLLLPANYPAHSPPRPIWMKASLQQCSWLSRKTCGQIAGKMATMWREEVSDGEGMEVIFRWWDWVANGDFLEEFGLLVDGRLKLSVPPMIPVSTFHTLLKSHNAAQVHSEFQSTAYSCSICFENRMGTSCIRLPCGCIFCTPCLNSCWTLAITEGSLINVSCPSPQCVKTRATRSDGETSINNIDSGTIRSVVGEDLERRWQELRERRQAEIDPTYTVCPRSSCQAPVPPPPKSSQDTPTPVVSGPRIIRLADLTRTEKTEEDQLPTPPPTANSEDRWDRYRSCPKCNYSFCLFCGNGWHGVHLPCAFPKTSEIVLEYLSYSEGSEERRRMEIRRGKMNLEKMVRQYREDEENKQWLDSRTRPCSGCGVRVEKSHGCNHMTCNRCHSHFCYRCGLSLSPSDPYAHYRHPGTSCFEKLFDPEEIQRFDREAGEGLVGDEWPRGIWEW
ncbi:hypothetical protein TREMEDRAFT_24487 [Tremella mesenterica DSM 1558]|uniref:uncharacterized protein n=1 Tax=Tremella mesenterica (strain ATCC 24925 / CBS 8224 / DSM 1558 / NBRC 9311 / NRRL Y-6157 / RJB 2259-6 / UBC 559-6) TaxID=578456 RepID=UPI0003F490F2|nr:uncharacterized protein TREMEDRAFT_24487 [Tremella mesenterica DSM 1558]EIW72764.1 hypothetical protein TREMEDRAFT_24487 [Tremella mesenterica DSM 1558]